MDDQLRNEESLRQFARLAHAARWLFWVVLIYTALWTCRAALISAMLPMNPVARSTAWGRFRWHLPFYMDFACLVVALILLYFSQSELIKGYKTDDARLIDQGMHHLFQFVVALAVFGVLKIVFEFYL